MDYYSFKKINVDFFQLYEFSPYEIYKFIY